MLQLSLNLSKQKHHNQLSHSKILGKNNNNKDDKTG